MHSSILRRIWLNFIAQYLFFRLLSSFHTPPPPISNFFGLSTTEETLVFEMRIWCIKIGIVLILHFQYIDAGQGRYQYHSIPGMVSLRRSFIFKTNKVNKMLKSIDINYFTGNIAYLLLIPQ
jgi:hypothetical protein